MVPGTVLAKTKQSQMVLVSTGQTAFLVIRLDMTNAFWKATEINDRAMDSSISSGQGTGLGNAQFAGAKKTEVLKCLL